MTKLFALLLIPILLVTLCCNFVRIIVTDDPTNTISFFVITQNFSQVNSDMTCLYEGFDDVASWFFGWLSSIGDLTMGIHLHGSFFDVVGGLAQYVGDLIGVFGTLPILARGLVRVVGGINLFIGDIFSLLNNVLGFSFDWVFDRA